MSTTHHHNVLFFLRFQIQYAIIVLTSFCISIPWLYEQGAIFTVTSFKLESYEN